ncbi:hypothetical protein BAU07_18760 [Bordetella flabilis]|uniref:Uncharacterized protein n=1 Tax=Bordetella flabilis TaxID=463014 RepID=A0A193GHY7_9BORD|nr:hypothetical protein BAU07_18760 [Bordetella flabilis]
MVWVEFMVSIPWSLLKKFFQPERAGALDSGGQRQAVPILLGAAPLHEPALRGSRAGPGQQPEQAPF